MYPINTRSPKLYYGTEYYLRHAHLQHLSRLKGLPCPFMCVRPPEQHPLCRCGHLCKARALLAGSCLAGLFLQPAGVLEGLGALIFRLLFPWTAMLSWQVPLQHGFMWT